MKKYNIAVSVILIGVGVYVIRYAAQFPAYYNGTPGPGFWPKLLAILLIACSVVLAVKTLVEKKDDRKILIDFGSKGVRQVLKLFVIMILFGVGLHFIGFIPSSVLFVPLVMHAMGERRWRTMLITSVAITASIYFVFAVGLGLMLPTGRLF